MIGCVMHRALSVMELAAALLLLAGGQALAREAIAGPVMAEVVRVIDGDTIEFRAHVWLGLDVTANVRIRGIDAPEVRGRCAREKEMAAAASARLAALVAGDVTLRNISDDKYAGRVLADVSAGGVDLAAAMIDSGLARPYDGGARGAWCDVARLGD